MLLLSNDGEIGHRIEDLAGEVSLEATQDLGLGLAL
jgi:hypothetical protein